MIYIDYYTGLARAIVLLNMVQMLPFIYPWITVPPKLYVKGEYYWNVNYEWYYWLITANPFLRFPGIEEKKLFLWQKGIIQKQSTLS